MAKLAGVFSPVAQGGIMFLVGNKRRLDSWRDATECSIRMRCLVASDTDCSSISRVSAAQVSGPMAA